MSDFYADRLFNAMERNEVAPGMLLVAAPDMASEDFERSIVLIIEHSPATTFGVNISSRSDVAVANVLPEWVDLTSKPQALYIGGPLSQQAVVGLGVTKPGVDIENSTSFNKLANRLVHVDLRSAPEDVADDLEGMRFLRATRSGLRASSTRKLSRVIGSSHLRCRRTLSRRAASIFGAT